MNVYKNVYKYDELTKEYTGVETAQLDPLESKVQGKEVYLLPANSTFIAPLVVKDGYTQVFKDGVWNYVEDNRGKEYWLDTDEYGTPARTMKELGTFPANAVFEAPQKPFEMVKAELEGTFPGGQTLTFNIANDGVGIPENNPNLSTDTTEKANEVYNKVKNGEIEVKAEQGELLEQFDI